MTETEKRVPELRFKGFIEDWEQRKFSKIVKRVSVQSNDSNLPKVEFEDIVSGEGRLNKDISRKFDSRKGTVFEPGYILYGKLRPYLKNWLFANFKGIALGDFWIFKPNNSSSIFDYYLIQSDKYQTAANLSSGTKMPRSDWKIVSETVFNIPNNTDEQEKVGSFFKKLDTTIALHQRKLNLLKQLKQTSLHLIFPQNEENSPTLRFDGFTMKWDQRKLGDVTTKIGSGKTPKGGNSVYTQSGVPLLRSQNIYNDRVNFEDTVYITESTDNEMSNSRVEKNDVLLNITGASIGRTAVYEMSSHSNVNQHVCIIRPIYEIDSYFIQLNLTSLNGQKQIELNQAGGGREGLNFQQIGKIVFSYPSSGEQKKIGDFFKRLDKTTSLHQSKLEKLLELKNVLLGKMFR